MEEQSEWVSVSEAAKRLGYTSQMLYLHIKEGKFEVMPFKRGSMNGYLVKMPKEKKTE